MSVVEYTTAADVRRGATEVRRRLMALKKSEPPAPVPPPPEPEPLAAEAEQQQAPQEAAEAEQRVSVRTIQQEVARFYRVSFDEMLSERRHWNIRHPRQVAYYLARTMTLQSLPDIGRRFRRDHTTIMHGLAKIRAMIEHDERLQDEIELIKIKIARRLKEARQ